MSGCLVRALDRKRFDFAYLAGSASQSVVLTPVIDVCDYGFIGIYARVHERSMVSGQSLVISLYNILPSDEDAREFVETDASGRPVAILDLTLTNLLPAGVPGMYYNSTKTSGPQLKLALKATQASVASTFYIEISVVLLLRES